MQSASPLRGRLILARIMAMELVVQKRQKFGKAARGFRREGLIPAELYGHGLENLHLAVNAKDFSKVFAVSGENTVVTLVVGTEKRPVLIHEVDRDYLGGDIRHVDFYQVKLDEKIRAKVPLELEGDAPAVKAFGGILNKNMDEVEVEALPNDLPHRLHVSLTTLDVLGKSVYIKDLAVPNGVKILIDPETVVATVTEPRKEEEVPAAPVDVSAVKVESEEKKAERAASKAEKGPGEQVAASAEKPAKK